MNRRIGIAFATAATLLATTTAAAQSAPCKVGRFETSTSTFHLDANGNGTWDGDAGGDRSTPVDLAAGAGVPVIGDWNGDGFDDVGKGNVATGAGAVVSFRIDADGDGIYAGESGGDLERAFGDPAQVGPGAPAIADWDGDGDDDFAVFVPTTSLFLVDLNGNRVWNGNAGGDRLNAFAVFAGPGVAAVGNWDGGAWAGDPPPPPPLSRELGRWVAPYFYLDANANFRWDGTAGGDVRAWGGLVEPLVGDWNRDGRDEIGSYSPKLGARKGSFAVDFASGGFQLTDTFAFGASFVGTPIVCDWDGDGTTNLGLLVGERFLIDANANGRWDGVALGDRSLPFAAPGDVPVVGRWKP